MLFVRRAVIAGISVDMAISHGNAKSGDGL